MFHVEHRIPRKLLPCFKLPKRESSKFIFLARKIAEVTKAITVKKLGDTGADARIYMYLSFI